MKGHGTGMGMGMDATPARPQGSLPAKAPPAPRLAPLGQRILLEAAPGQRSLLEAAPGQRILLEAALGLLEAAQGRTPPVLAPAAPLRAHPSRHPCPQIDPWGLVCIWGSPTLVPQCCSLLTAPAWTRTLG